MKCIVGIDLGSTTTKAVLLDEEGRILGQGITNSRSNYEVASAVARQEAHVAARFRLLRDELRAGAGAVGGSGEAAAERLERALLEAFRLEVYLAQLSELRGALAASIDHGIPGDARRAYKDAAETILDAAAKDAPRAFSGGARKSDFFRDLISEAFVVHAEKLCVDRALSFERLMGAFDRAIIDMERHLSPWGFGELLRSAARRVSESVEPGERARIATLLDGVAERIAGVELEEVAFAGTGYGRQTLPFPKEAVRSEILCHGRGAHRVFFGTRTVLDIGGQDTKAVQVDERGVVTSFQMNDRCAAGCGRYLGYVADELNLGLHELGPLALSAKRVVKVSSTCTVFAGAELKERLALGERREDILAGLHRAIMLRAMALLARSGGVHDQLTFTGGVCKNGMATKVLRELVDESYGTGITLNVHPDSIYMGALGAALFALDDRHAGTATAPTALREMYARASAEGARS